jgi:Subtilisin inhibitor-like
LGVVTRALALAVVLAAASCGEGSATEEPAAPAETSVEVTLWPNGRGAGPEHSALLECNPSGGTHDRPEEACAALAEQEDALDPVPGGVACTQIYGGPLEARVFGTVGGREVDVFFNRTNGCEIDRWDRLAPVLEISAGKAGPR